MVREICRYLEKNRAAEKYRQLRCGMLEGR